MESRRNRPLELAITLLFLAALFGPLLLWGVQKEQYYSETEKRELRPFPSLADQDSIRGLFQAFDGYFQDHFGLREWLIHRYQRETSKRFGLSGTPLVVDGSQGWLFYAGDGILEDLKGRTLLDPGEEERFGRILERKKNWLNGRGIRYIFMVAPNKQSIYPEFLPRHYRQARGKTRLDHLLGSGKADGLLDVREELLDNKKNVRLYDKSDTHWNYHGALVAYQALMKRVEQLFPGFRPRQDFPFQPGWAAGPGGDLALISGRTRSIVEKRPVLNRKDFQARTMPISAELAALLRLKQIQPVYTVNPSGQLRVLVLHDSFFNVIAPFAGESFRETFYLWQYYDTSTLEFFNSRQHLEQLLDLYRPDLVIEETLERFLPRYMLSNAWLLDNES
jgi:hypothetical protein